MTQKLVDLGGKLEAKRTEWMDKFSKFNLVGDGQAVNMTGADIVDFKAYEAEVNELQGQFDSARAMYFNDAALRSAKFDPYILQRPTQQKSLTDLVLAKGIGEIRSAGATGITFDEVDTKGWLSGKATMLTSANGYTPEVLRDGDYVPKISRPPQLIDYLPSYNTTQNGISFVQQTVRTSGAAATSEGSAMGESTLTYAPTTDIISRIGNHIPVSEEELEDVDELRQLIDYDLMMMVRQELDRQVTVGNGSAPELRGIYTATNVQTQAAGSDPTIVAILKAITKIRVTGRANPGIVALHATDHQFLALTRTADGLFILGNPTDTAVKQVWGVPIVLSEALTVTNGLVLDPFYFRVAIRKGVTVESTNSHASNFTSNLWVIKASIRAGLKKRRGEAACTITGLPTS